jgi:UDP-N-acetylglucosamine:LPS N-acetylglucosamine transferase
MKEQLYVPKNVRYISLANSDVLYQYIQHSSGVISRSGYSTIMDLMYMQSAAVLIPTPGQTEQQYLAQHLEQKKMFSICSQQLFDLQTTNFSIVDTIHFVSNIPTL